MTPYRRGKTLELEVAEDLRGRGWVVTIASRSLGPHDLHASRRGFPCMLVQAKSDKRGPFANFGPADRIVLLNTAHQAGANAVLAWNPRDRKGTRYIPARDWPPHIGAEA